MTKKIVLIISVLWMSFWTLPAVAASVNLPDFTELVQSHSPQVVKIGAVTKAKVRNYGYQYPDSQDLPEIFKYFFDQSPYRQGPQQQQPMESTGSGFIVSSDGYILTNNHVVNGADEVTVWMTDRSQYHAEVIGTDERTDLALLKIDAKGLSTVEFADSDKLKVGEWVLAIGSPFNLDYSVTAGIVSAIGRNIGENYVPFIQTDVAINPGNSGGPLFNLDGQVVGINSQIYTRSGGYMGVSFSIPSNLAKNVYEQLKANGKVSRGWLGVLIQGMNQDLAESYGLKKPEGALVTQVMEDSPAAAGGIRNGDIILEFDGKHIDTSAALPPIVGRVQPGEKVKVKVLREGREKTLTLTIAELPTQDKLAQNGSAPHTSSNSLNIVVQNIDPDTASKLGEKGVRVIEVDQGPAADAGLQPGDVITMVGSRKVESVGDFDKVISSIPSGKAFALRVMRNGSPMFLPIRIE
ncbi:DegQ family serine endoprotease [Gynuella sunshinyii]|uniref:Probable periplasmic serine endoprotease DegP-like n=1 Tax=Gynuella sunshinyii YC6258 TaxID=1445510 RepID=A0A0C5VJS1_9GAMM|nr:DegQ family serine endoprotease [Gynuella sunshinyii]AJQ94536.1 trypsin-like serine protease, typically periplasmic, containing C-terminal PDZ domain [Gynuella sunshinyii YC6258]